MERRRLRSGWPWHGVLIGGVLVVLAACAGTPGASSVPSAPVASAAPSAPATTAPTPTPSAPPSEAAIPSPSPSSACTITTDVAPEMGKRFYLSGMGFAPDVDIEVTFIEPDGTEVFPPPDLDIQVPALHTSADGTFGPWDIMYEDSDERGDIEIQASDGDCRASIFFTLE